MKNVFKLLMLLVLVSSLSFIGCSNPLAPKTTELTIVNNTSTDIDIVKWNGISFGDDTVYDYTLGKYVDGIAAGSESTKEVTAGSGYIYFYFVDSNTKQQSTHYVTVGEGKHLQYTFNWHRRFEIKKIRIIFYCCCFLLLLILRIGREVYLWRKQLFYLFV